MRIARLIAHLLMIVIFLPWGAYAGIVTTPPRADLLAVSETAQATVTGQDQTRITASKTCRTATLPGFSCATDQAIPAKTLAEWHLPPSPLAGPAADWARRDRTDPPPRDPPRFS